MFLPIYQYGHPVLRKLSVDIDENYNDLHKLIADLYDTMSKSDGIGLAAPQVGKNIRLFVVDGSGIADDYPEVADFKRTFINAHITETSNETMETSEGCLSLPGISEKVARPKEIHIKYVDENFLAHDEVISGYAAVIVQHEYDHLDGKVFIDHIGPLRKRLLKSKLTSISKGTTPVKYRVVLP